MQRVLAAQGLPLRKPPRAVKRGSPYASRLFLEQRKSKVVGCQG